MSAPPSHAILPWRKALGTVLLFSTTARLVKVLSPRVAAPVCLWAGLVCLAAADHPVPSAKPSAEPLSPRPNFVLLVSDDQRWDTLGCMGNSVIRTPNLDQLARDGLLFRNAFVTTSVCSISRASLLTGSHARARGVGDLVAMVTPEDEAMTYPAVLRQLGYQTGHIGKWDVGAGEEGFQFGARLFDFWAGDRLHGNYWHSADCPVVRADSWQRSEARCDCPPAGSLPRIGRAGLKNARHFDRDIVPLKVLEFLRGRDPAKPFLLSVSFRGPKDPWSDYPEEVAEYYSDILPPLALTSPEEAASQPEFLRNSMGSQQARSLLDDRGALAGEVRRYYRQISSVDAAVGAVRQLLANQGLTGNTVVIFTSDNGHFLGEHGFWGKWLPYEPSIRVPLIIANPRTDAKNRGLSREEMVLNIDLAPTLVALAGGKAQARMQGRDVTPLLRGGNAEWRKEWFYEHSWTAEGRIAPSEALRTHRWKLVRYPEKKPVFEQLFDLQADPGEMKNLVHDPRSAEVARDLRRRLEACRGEARGAR
jgi:Arylsulfatase A and related enzymes